MSSTQLATTRRQGLTILTTEGCNFACVYCHQPHTPLHMGPEVMASIVRFVEREAKTISHLDVSWFGGEPLVNQKAVIGLSREFQRVCSGNGVALHGFMSTNAFLLSPQLLCELVGLGTSRYQITFDGPQQVHDRHRLAANGSGTFARLWDHVRSYRALRLEFEILIRVHVTPATVGDVRGFLSQLGEELGEDPRFKITIANVSHWGGPNDPDIPVFDDPGPILRELAGAVREPNQPVGENAFCNAANPSHFVIRPNGEVVKCAHSLDLVENRIGHLAPDDSFVYEPGKLDYWIRGIITGDRAALECPRDGLETLHPARALLRKLPASRAGAPTKP